MALAAEVQRQSRANGLQRTIKASVKAATKIYKGALVAKNAAGYVLPAADVAGQTVIGVAMETVDNTGGADGALTIRVTTGVFKFTNYGADPCVQADMHGIVRVQDDTTVRNAGGTADIIAGILEQIDSDGVWVHVDASINVALAT